MLQFFAVAPLELGDAVQAVDATRVYVRSTRGIIAVEKNSGTVTELYTSAPDDGIWFLLVDDESVYFLGYRHDGLAIQAIAKTGGPARELSPGLLYNSSPWQMAQDQDSLYILRARNDDLSTEILRLPKNGTGGTPIDTQGGAQ